MQSTIAIELPISCATELALERLAGEVGVTPSEIANFLVARGFSNLTFGREVAKTSPATTAHA